MGITVNKIKRSSCLTNIINLLVFYSKAIF